MIQKIIFMKYCGGPAGQLLTLPIPRSGPGCLYCTVLQKSGGIWHTATV